MAQLNWNLKTLSGLFKTRVAETFQERFFKPTKKSMEKAQRMTSVNGSMSPKFNNMQCRYLAEKLKATVESAQESDFFKYLKVETSSASADMASILEIFKLLYALSKEVESFIQACCQDAWIQAAVWLSNVEQHILSIGFNLELCTLFFTARAEFEGVYEDEAKNVRKQAAADMEALLTKLYALEVYDVHSPSTEYQLAAFLIDRLGRPRLAMVDARRPAMEDTRRPAVGRFKAIPALVKSFLPGTKMRVIGSERDLGAYYSTHSSWRYDYDSDKYMRELTQDVFYVHGCRQRILRFDSLPGAVRTRPMLETGSFVDNDKACLNYTATPPEPADDESGSCATTPAPYDDSSLSTTSSGPHDEASLSATAPVPYDDSSPSTTASEPHDEASLSATAPAPDDDSSLSTTASEPQDEASLSATAPAPCDDSSLSTTASEPQDEASLSESSLSESSLSESSLSESSLSESSLSITSSEPHDEASLSRSSESSLSEVVFRSLIQKEVLGKGSAGIVHKVLWMGAEFAMKTFLGPNNRDFNKEVSTLSGLSHPNIIFLLCSKVGKRRCSIVMELMDGDLSSLMHSRLEGRDQKSPFTIFEAVDLMLQVAEGMRYLHERRIVHRDLKSLNILVKRVKTLDSEIDYVIAKVADFGLSRTKEMSMTYSNQTPNMGTTRWMAPETMKLGYSESEVQTLDTSEEVKYPYKCDVYNFAMVCYEILTGKVPFSGLSKPCDIRKLVLEGGRPRLPRECPKELKKLVKSCWNPDPSKRPSFSDICADLRYLKFLLLCRASLAIQAN